ncbi:MAG: hypothetical protein ABFD96_18090 [Armatimonadia bacterium]
MRIVGLLLLCATCSAVLAADEAFFPLGTYWPWERLCGHAERLGVDKWTLVDQRLDDMKAHQMDTLWVVNLNIKDLGPLAERVAKRDMKLIPALGELHYNLEWRRNNWEYLEKESRRALEAAGSSPAILAWALCDEPRRNIVAEVELFRQKFEQWGAKQPGIVVTMWPDTPTYARETGFPYPCTDIYPFFSDKNPNGPNPANVSRGWYRRQVETTVKAALEKGRVPWVMPQMFADIWGPWKYDEKGDMTILPGGVLHWRVPTVGETRWQVWSALGLGAQGVIFYVHESPVKDNADKPPYEGKTFPESMKATAAAPMGSGGLIRPDGSATPQYDALTATFADVRKLLPVLRGAKPLDIWPVQVAAPGWVGVLKNEALKKTYYVVVNDDTDRPSELKLTGEVKGLTDLRTGEALKADAAGVVVVKLGAGEGTVLEGEE